jgi:hypothetical protein
MTIARRAHDTLITASVHEQAALDDLAHALSESSGTEAVLLDLGGAHQVLPPSVQRLLRDVVLLLRDRGAVVVQSVGPVVTLDDAADLLGEPAADVLADMVDGVLPARSESGVWQVALTDLLAYRARRQVERTAAIAEIIRVGEELEAERPAT